MAQSTHPKTIAVKTPISRRTNDPCHIVSTIATRTIVLTVTVKTSKNDVGCRRLGSLIIDTQVAPTIRETVNDRVTGTRVSSGGGRSPSSAPVSRRSFQISLNVELCAASTLEQSLFGVTTIISRPMKIRVDWRASVSLTGTICKYLSLALFVPLAVAVVYQRDILVFVVTIVITVTIGLLLERVDPDPELRPREAMLLVALSWFAVAILGAIPYLLATVGTDSSLAHPVNALFESMSGFTTTGATVMDEISTDRYSHA